MLGLFKMKRYPTPLLKHYWPFFVGGALVYYGATKVTSAMMQSEEYINDPRNPRFVKGEKPTN